MDPSTISQYLLKNSFAYYSSKHKFTPNTPLEYLFRNSFFIAPEPQTTTNLNKILETIAIELNADGIHHFKLNNKKNLQTGIIYFYDFTNPISDKPLTKTEHKKPNCLTKISMFPTRTLAQIAHETGNFRHNIPQELLSEDLIKTFEQTTQIEKTYKPKLHLALTSAY